MPIIAPIPRNERRQMKKIIQNTRDKDYARRLMAILMLHRGESVSLVAKTLCASRSSVYRWINWLTLYGLEGLKSLPVGRPAVWNLIPLYPLLSFLLQSSPQQLGCLRSRWSLEFFIIKINELLNIKLSISTFYRYLHKMGIVWRRAAPTLKLPDPEYPEKMAKITEALSKCSEKHPVFYEDEVDIELNPKIGADWYLKGQQKRIVTPGKNQKHYFAGCLNVQTGKVTYADGLNKNSQLVINVLEELERQYCHAETLTLILDNYSIHKSRRVRDWLACHPKFNLLFLPVYSPWLNKIERLWQSLHETVTRNHGCQYMWQLLEKVKTFLNSCPYRNSRE
ncbi:IS630-like element ISPlu10 family transposase [Photorhabdus hainanensis]|uniref:IS630-like element ISPlu10 family transposase n=1 Tax=Photorhabdus hainanensis TaxID=1004166 RepID=UPI001BD38CD4|nr:IS630-like element ISPlu10 family transposase [Photorhabdus hainanensis]MBS9435580.1 IS630 family transposase [Photorhabdus hainanensis]